MGLNVRVSDGLLKKFIGQDGSETSDYYCGQKAYMGLLGHGAGPTVWGPTIKNDPGTGRVEYWTDELVPSYCTGYERDVVGVYNVAELKKMDVPSNGSTSNNQLLEFGENTRASGNWTDIYYFGIFNKANDNDGMGGIDIHPTTQTDMRWSKALVLWGALNSMVQVPVNHVPLFRVGNFTLTFSSN